MKKTLFTSFIAVFAIALPASAQTTTPLKANPAPIVKEVRDYAEVPDTTKVVPSVDTLIVKKQKIDTDMRATLAKLQVVIDRTQVLIDLLTKNGKDTAEAASFLADARLSLTEGTDALDQFAGVVVPPTDETVSPKATARAAASTRLALKDPLKKAEDALKESKVSLIASITALKTSAK